MVRSVSIAGLVLIVAACAGTGRDAADADRIARLESENAELRQEVERLKTLGAIHTLKSTGFSHLITIDPQDIDTVVTAVDPERSIVVLDAGRDDGVVVGNEFTIYREAEYVSRVRIDAVAKEYSSGYAIKELEKSQIRVGDKATTRY